MSYNLIPVLTVDDKKYNQPTQKEGGLYVVNKGAIPDAPSNKFYFYNPNSGKYYYVNEQTASPDRLKQLTDYEEQLNKIGRIAANGTDPTQINSVADIVSKMFSGGTFEDEAHLMPEDVLVHRKAEAITDAFNFIKDMTVYPLFNKDLSGKDKAGILINNALVNLNETLDYFTGANAVKAILKGEDISDGLFWNPETGRAQYDWNADTGLGGATDFFANTFMEIVSDPTNWITLGGKAAITKILTNSVDDVALKLGYDVNREYLEQFTRKFIKTGTPDSFKTMDYRKLFNLGEDFSNESVDILARAFTSSLEVSKATKQLNLVKSVMGTVDYYERTAFKAAMSTSAIGLEAMGVYKMGKEWALPWIKNKLNDLFKYKKTNGEFKYSNYVQVYEDTKRTGETYNDLTGVYEHTSTEYANAVSATMRSDIVRDLQRIDGIKEFNKKVTALEKWALDNEFTSIQDAYEKFKSIRDDYHGEVTYIVNMLEAIVDTLAAQADNIKLSSVEAMLELMENAAAFKEFNINTVYEDNPIKELINKSSKYDVLIKELPTRELLSPEHTMLLVDTLKLLKYHNVVEGLEYIATAMNRIDPNNIVLSNLEELWRELCSIAQTIGIDLTMPSLVDDFTKYGLKSIDDVADMVTVITDTLYLLKKLILDLKQYGVKDLDLFYNVLYNIELVIDGVKASSKWGEYIDGMSNTLNEYKNKLNHDVIEAKRMSFEGFKGAHMRGVTNKSGTVYMSNILNDMLKNTDDTSDAFIHFKDYKDLADVEYEFTFNDLLPVTVIDSVGVIDSLEGLFNYLLFVLERFNFYGVDELTDFIKSLSERVAKIRVDETSGDAVYVAYETPTMLLNTTDIEETINVLRKAVKDIVSHADEGTEVRTVEKEIPKEFIKKVWSGEWTEELFRERTGVEYNKVYSNVDNGKWYVKVVSTPAVNASSVAGAELFEAIADNLQDFLERLQIEAGKIYVSPEQLKSPIYAMMLSKARSLILLVDNGAIKDPLSRILTGEGAGAIIRTLKQYDDTAHSAEALHSLAVSMQVYSDILTDLKNNDAISDEWAGAITDSLAGIMRRHYTDIRLDDLTDEIISLSKLFINKKNNSLPSVSKYVGFTYKPEHHVDVLASVLFDKTAHNVRHTPDEEYVNLVQDIIPKAVNPDEYNVAFSIGQFSKRAGVFELVCELPDEIPGYGKRIHFVDDTADIKAFYSDPRYAEEVLGQDYTMTKVSGDYAPDAVHFNSTDAFVIAVNEFLEALKAHVNPYSSKEFKTIRFVGFGNSADYNKQNEVFNDFLHQNLIKFYLDDHISSINSAKTLDIKQWLHTHYGATTASEDLYNAVKGILFKSKQTLDNYNAGAEYVKASIVPDISRGILNAIDNLVSNVETALYNKSKLDIREAVGTTRSLMNLPKKVLEAVHGELKSFSAAVVDGLRNIKNSNRDYAREWIIGDLFNKLTNEPNIMHFFNTYVFDTSEGGVFDNSLVRKHTPELVASWYGEDFLKTPQLAQEIEEINVLLKSLQYTVDSIARRELVYAPSSLRATEKVLHTLHEFIKKNTYSVVTRRNIEYIERMHYGLMPEQQYAIGLYYMKEFIKLPKKVQDNFHNTVINAWTLKDTDASTYYGLIKNSHNTVLNKKTGMYLPEIDYFRSMRFDESYDIYDALRTQKEVELASLKAECFMDSLVAEDAILTKYGVNGTVYRLKHDMLKAYSSFADVPNQDLINARRDFLYEISRAKDAVERYEIKRMYTEKIKIIHERINKVAEFHAYARDHIILHTGIEDYEKYIYRYSQGVQVFDTNSKLLQSKQLAESFINRIAFINSPDNHTAVRSVKGQGCIIMYIDKNVGAEYIERLHDSVIGHTDKKTKYYTPGINMHFDVLKVLKDMSDEAKKELKANPYFRAYLKMQNTIEHTHNVAYSVSMHRTMNEDRFKELLDFLPKEVKDNMLDLDYWVSTGWLNGALSHTMVGDYNSGLGTVFKTYSGNLITNINSGVNGLYKQSISREGYITFFTSPANSLEVRINMYNQAMAIINPDFKPLSAKEIADSLDGTGFRVASFDGSSLTPHDISTEEGLRKALESKAVIMDMGVYDKIFRTIVDNSVSGGWFADYLFLLKIGMLQSPGWIFRNIIDSVSKGMITTEAGLIEYSEVMVNTFKKLRAFERLQDKVLSEYKTLSESGIRKLFREYPERAAECGISLEEALEYAQFSKNSASVPTATQLNSMANVRDNLRGMFSEDGNIKDVHIDKLLKEFIKHQGNKSLIKEALEKAFDDDDIVRALMNVVDRIPKGYAKMHGTNIISKLANLMTERNPLMKFNNDVERLSRFTVYEHSRSMGKTKSAAIEDVNASQFNRAYDHNRTRVLEMFFPFTSFQMDNAMFWAKTLTNAKGSILGMIANILQGYYDEEEVTPEEIMTNLSVQYMFLQGNIMLDDDGSLTLKISNSLFNTMEALINPLGTLKDSLNIPMEKLIMLYKACNQDVGEYKENPYGKVMPISLWTDKDYEEYAKENGLHTFAVDLIPVIGAWWLRAQTSWEEGLTNKGDVILRQFLPSVFGRVKRTGVDWYGENDNPEYHDTHTFVAGISYVPSWIDLKDHKTYANTFQRLVDLGYAEEVARKMVVDWGYYMKAPDYILRQYKPHQTYAPKVYPKKVYAPKPTYTKKVYPKKGYTKKFNMISGGDRYRTTRFGVARIYRLTSMYDRITKSGTSRMTMMLGRGHGASSIRVVRDRIKNNTIRRQRQRRILHM